MTKSELKNIIKECLVEIFQESLTNNEGLKRNQIEKPKSSQLYKHVENKKAEQHFVKSQKPVSLMEEMLADTARTTLRSQSQAEQGGARNIGYADKMSQIVDQSTPEELFGNENTTKWTKLAFFDEKNK